MAQGIATEQLPPKHRRNVPVDAPSGQHRNNSTLSGTAEQETAERETAEGPPTNSPSTNSAHADAAHAEPRRPGAQSQDGSGPAANRWWTLTAVCLGTFMLLLDVTIINVALPDIQTALGASFSGLQWVVDAYALTLAALLLTAGSLADMFGRRKLYIVGLVIFTLSSLLCGVAQKTLVLQLSRGLQGVGGAIMFAVSLALLADAFRGKDRGIAFGIWGAITGLAVAIGPLLGGLLTTELSWRWIFFVNLPIGIVAVVISVLKVSESRSPNARRPDWAGFVIFTVALSSLVYGLIESNERSFGNGLVIGALVGAAVLLAAFVVVELRGSHPMFDLSLFRLPTFTGGAVAAFGVSATIFALLLYLVLYLQDILRFDALGTGLRLLVLSAGVLATSTLSGRLSAHVPVRLLIGPGLLLVGVGLLLMRGLDVQTTWTHLIPGLIVSGVGVGMITPPLASTAVGVVTPQRAGMASGISSTFRQVGIATGIALLGSLFSSKVSSEVHERVAAVPALAGQGSTIATAVQSGAIGTLLSRLPASSRATVANITTSAFTAGLNRILLVAAIVAFAAGVISLLTIRGKDFVQQHS
jgi:EmrB/QacA subfamily drug resistance transporter